MTRWKKLSPKKQLLIGLSILVILAAGLIAFFTVSHAVKIQKLKANADFILVLDGKEAYLPCKISEVPFRFETPPYAIYSLWKTSPSTGRDDNISFPEGGWDYQEAFSIRGYNNTRKEIYLTDYIARGVSTPEDQSHVHRTADIQIRGGKLGSGEFLTRGVRLGDSAEDVERILGEPEDTIENAQGLNPYQAYYFNAEDGGQYRLCVIFQEDLVTHIFLDYSFPGENSFLF